MTNRQQAFVPSAMPFIKGPGQNNKAVNYKPTTMNTSQSNTGKANIRQAQTQTNTFRDSKTGGRIASGKIKRGDRDYKSIAPNIKYEKKEEMKSNPTTNSNPYGFNDTNSKQAVFASNPVNYLLLDPLEYGKFSILPQMSINTARLINNTVAFDPIGLDGSYASQGFKNLFNNIYQKMVQDTSATAATIFTLDNMKVYIRTVSDLLDSILEIESILAYNPDLANQVCEPLKYIKSFVCTPYILDMKESTTSTLKTYWLPTGLQNFLVWKNQSYRLSNIDQSVVAKLTSIRFNSLASNSGVPVGSAYADYWTGLINKLNASTDSANGLTYKTTSLITAYLRRYCGEDGYLQKFPIMSNTTHYDETFNDLFNNQFVLYGTVSTYPEPQDANTPIPYATCKNNPKDITDVSIGLQSFFVTGGTSKGGLLREWAYPYSATSNCNKHVWYSAGNNNAFNVQDRNNYENNNSSDFHCIDVNGANVRKVTKTNSDKQLVYTDGSTGLNLVVRALQERMLNF